MTLLIKITELKNRDVVNVNDGRRLGVIGDLDVDLERGVVNSIIIPTQKGFWSKFSASKEHVISWKKIVKIGVDTILVDYPQDIYGK